MVAVKLRPTLYPRGQRGIKLTTAARALLTKCVHFTGLDKSQCALKVSYQDVEMDLRQKPNCYVHPYPCLNPDLDSCRFRELPTPMQAQQMADEATQGWGRALVALSAILAHSDKHDTLTGNLRCPNCKEGTIRYTRGRNSRGLMAACSTPGCTKIIS